MVQMTNTCLEISFDKLAEFTSLLIHWFKEEKVKLSEAQLRQCFEENQLVYLLTTFREANFVK